MNENKNEQQAKKLYIVGMVLLAVSAVINIIAMRGIVYNKIANLIDVLMLVISVLLTKQITKLENGKRSGSIYISFVVVAIAWFITYMAMWLYNA